jgi:hypothetical protein
MKFTQEEKYLPKVEVLINQNGNLAFKAYDELLGREEQLVEVSKELFVSLVENYQAIIEAMDDFAPTVLITEE